jgi:hypothetical protein
MNARSSAGASSIRRSITIFGEGYLLLYTPEWPVMSPGMARSWMVTNDKQRACLNCIKHLLSTIPYKDLAPQEITVPPRQEDTGYVRPPREGQRFVPEVY